MELGSNLGKRLHIPSVEPSQSKKQSNIKHRLWPRLVHYTFNLLLHWPNGVVANDMPNILDLPEAECALRPATLQFFALQRLQHPTDMRQMVSLGLSVDKDVVQLDLDKYINEILEN